MVNFFFSNSIQLIFSKLIILKNFNIFLIFNENFFKKQQRKIMSSSIKGKKIEKDAIFESIPQSNKNM